ncbi:hypothetical protein PoB_007033300 [Plakobranchus ocellatus]|uniref:Uncharacterized protein n=1 Tax=Plakobranchus ocellatus TaxID=259542 RepID=A0AAV4DHX5_9GAST|nr:hypothetical protein PoB_007033300 [Plakobranchus ocellatus]
MNRPNRPSASKHLSTTRHSRPLLTHHMAAVFVHAPSICQGNVDPSISPYRSFQTPSLITTNLSSQLLGAMSRFLTSERAGDKRLDSEVELLWQYTVHIKTFRDRQKNSRADTIEKPKQELNPRDGWASPGV